MDLLTAYALDALEPEEIAQVTILLERQPELRRIVTELRATADQMPYALAEAAPPPEMRQRVLDYATGHTPRRSPAVTRDASIPRRWLRALAGFAVTAVAAAVIGWVQALGAQAALVQARSDLIAAQSSLAQANAHLATAQAMQQQVADALRPTSARANLTGAAGNGTIFRAPDGTGLLAAQLPLLPPGQVYQLWFIQGTNAPASGGVFVVDQQGRALLTFAPNQQLLSADTIAITAEPGPNGSPGPTTAILIAGNLPAS